MLLARDSDWLFSLVISNLMGDLIVRAYITGSIMTAGLALSRRF